MCGGTEGRSRSRFVRIALGIRVGCLEVDVARSDAGQDEQPVAVEDVLRRVWHRAPDLGDRPVGDSDRPRRRNHLGVDINNPPTVKPA